MRQCLRSKLKTNRKHCMEKISILPIFVTHIFKKLPLIFRGAHKHSLLWLVLLIALGIGNHKLTNMAQSGSVYTKEWRFRRFLSAGYWRLRAVLIFLVDEIVKELPRPTDATIYLVLARKPTLPLYL